MRSVLLLKPCKVYLQNTYFAFSLFTADTVTEPRANRKMGFGSFEARRRDEFSLDIKARMYKERVKGETVYVDQVLQDATGLLGEEKTGEYVPSPDEAHLFQTQVSTRYVT